MLLNLNDLYNHGLSNTTSNSGIGRHMLYYRSHKGDDATNYYTIILKYYQSIFKGVNFDKICVIDAVTDEVITTTPELLGDDSIRMVTTNGRPLEYGRSYMVNVPDGALCDKRNIPLIGGYHYTFTVRQDKTIVYVVTPDMDGAQINELLDTIYYENTDDENDKVLLSFPPTEINVGDTPIKYPHNTWLIGARLTSNAGIMVMEPKVPGQCYLRLTDCVINGTVVGEDLEINSSKVVNITNSKMYDMDHELALFVNNSRLSNLNIDNFVYDIYITDSDITCASPLVLSGRDIVITGSTMDIASMKVYGNNFTVIDSNIHITGSFNISDVSGSSRILGCILEGYGSLVYRDKADGSTFTNSNVSVIDCIINGESSDSTENIIIEMTGNTLPCIFIRNNIISGVDNMCYYKKETIDEYQTEDTPLMYITGNIIPEMSFVKTDTGMYQVIDIQISFNNTASTLTLPTNFFRGMVNSNIAVDNRLITRPDLLVRDNLFGKGDI